MLDRSSFSSRPSNRIASKFVMFKAPTSAVYSGERKLTATWL